MTRNEWITRRSLVLLDKLYVGACTSEEVGALFPSITSEADALEARGVFDANETEVTVRSETAVAFPLQFYNSLGGEALRELLEAIDTALGGAYDRPGLVTEIPKPLVDRLRRHRGAFR